MARVASDFKRGWLRIAKANASTNSRSLYAQLTAELATQIGNNSSGLVLTGTSTNGHSVTLAPNSNGQGATPQAIAELCSEMLDRWEAAVSFLELDRDEEDDTNDDAIFAEMLARLVKVTRYGMDNSAQKTGLVEVES